MVFVVHTVEELPGFASWASRHFGAMSTEAFAYSHIALIWLVFLASHRAARAGGRGGWAVVATALQWQFAVNAVFHLTTAVAFGEYSPGMVTAATVGVGATGYLLARVRRERVLTGRQQATALVAGTLLAAAAVGVLFLH